MGGGWIPSKLSKGTNACTETNSTSYSAPIHIQLEGRGCSIIIRVPLPLPVKRSSLNMKEIKVSPPCQTGLSWGYCFIFFYRKNMIWRQCQILHLTLQTLALSNPDVQNLLSNKAINNIWPWIDLHFRNSTFEFANTCTCKSRSENIIIKQSNNQFLALN